MGAGGYCSCYSLRLPGNGRTSCKMKMGWDASILHIFLSRGLSFLSSLLQLRDAPHVLCCLLLLAHLMKDQASGSRWNCLVPLWFALFKAKSSSLAQGQCCFGDVWDVFSQDSDCIISSLTLEHLNSSKRLGRGGSWKPSPPFFAETPGKTQPLW